MAQPKRTLYEIVGVAPDAPAAEVARACDARRAELDAEGSGDASTVALVRHAREVLTDPERRAAYDARIAATAPAAPAAAGEPAAEPAPEARPAGKRPGPPWGLLAVIGAAALIVVLFVARMMTNPVPSAPPPAAPKAPAPPPPAALTPAQVLAAVTPSVARLQAVDLSGNVLPLGLAVVTEPGIALTTCHAIPANAQILATFGTEKAAATLVITDEVLDLCKLSIAGAEPPPLPLAPGEARPGDRIYVVSPDAPGGFALAEATVKQAVKGAAGDAFQVSTNATNGAPVLDAAGKLVGIATSGQVLPASWIAQVRSRTR